MGNTQKGPPPVWGTALGATAVFLFCTILELDWGIAEQGLWGVSSPH
jgi:hypothetical protein